MYQLWVFSGSDRVAYLHQAYDIKRSGKLNTVPTLSFQIPADDPKIQYLTSAYSIRIWNTETELYGGIYDIVETEDVWGASGSVVRVECVGALGRLAREDNISYDTTSTPDTPENIITALLALQETSDPIGVGTIEPTTPFAFSIENSNILRAVLECTSYLGGYIEVDGDGNLNWWEEPTGSPTREIRYKKNLKGLNRKIEYGAIINRIYTYGFGESEAQITLIDAGEPEEYIEDAASIAAYGLSIRRFADKRIRHPETLLRWAQRLLDAYKEPVYSYNVDVVNLAAHPDYRYDLESLSLGDIVRVVNPDLDLNVDVVVVGLDEDLSEPHIISVELETPTPDLSDTISNIRDSTHLLQNQDVQIGAGQVTVQGVFTVDGWRSAGLTSIDGGNITTNTLDADAIKTSTLNAKTITLGTTGGDAIIKSGNYSAGTAGWQIEANGDAEFNNVIVRGTLGASTIGVGEAIIISGELKTSDGKFEIKTSGVTLKQTAADTTYLSLIQDSAQIQFYSASVLRAQYTPTGTIRLDTNAGTPIQIISTSAADCIDISTAQSNRRAIVAVSTPGSTAVGVATIHATNSTAGGYAVYAVGRLGASGIINADGGFVTIGSSDLRAVQITGNLTMAGTANISNVATISASTVTVGTISPISGSSITVSGSFSMSSYNITCNELSAPSVKTNALSSVSGGQIAISNSMRFTSGSYGLHFSNDSTNRVLFESGGDIYWRDSEGTPHKLN